MSGIGVGLAGLTIAQKLTRIGIVVAIFAALIGGVLLWGNSKYRAGHDDGVTQTEAKYEAAKQKLREEAEASASKADDKALERLEQHEAQVENDRKAVEDANANGTSPLDAIFG